MKYIKKFETKTNKMYWSIKKDKYIFKKSLKKLGVSDDNIEAYISNFKFFQNGTLYIAYNPNEKDPDEIWYVTSINTLDRYCKYMGEVELTPEELEEIEIERKLDKYNI